jgi:hypothetical protein
MSTKPAGAEAAPPRPPKCPHCKKDMPMVGLYPYQIGVLLLPSVQCPWCAVLLHLSIITPPPAQPAAEPETPPADPKIWRPQ